MSFSIASVIRTCSWLRGSQLTNPVRVVHLGRSTWHAISKPETRNPFPGWRIYEADKRQRQNEYLVTLSQPRKPGAIAPVDPNAGLTSAPFYYPVIADRFKNRNVQQTEDDVRDSRGCLRILKYTQ